LLYCLGIARLYPAFPPGVTRQWSWHDARRQVA
jgi:hypothetical protein